MQAEGLPDPASLALLAGAAITAVLLFRMICASIHANRQRWIITECLLQFSKESTEWQPEVLAGLRLPPLLMGGE